jgi:ElaA protein
MPESSSYARPWGELTTDEVYSFLKLRTDVFFMEQRIDETELDDRDRESATRHYWISDDAGTAAYLRTLVDDEPSHLDARRLIGRVVVRADRRGEGLAQRLLDGVILRDGHEAMLLHSQQYIAPLYVRLGFEPFGPVYPEAGIPHISMYRAGA